MLAADGSERRVPVERARRWATASWSAPARRWQPTAWSNDGTSAVDESMLTGEPMPLEKKPGASG